METSVRRYWRTLLALGLALMVTGCIPFVGDSEDEATPTPDVIPTVIRPGATATPSIAPPASPVPTLVPLPTQAPQTAATAPAACTPRADWPEYTVASGESLYGIALRTDTTTAALQSANCLDDPDRIFEGQKLRVPTVPSAPTPAATAAPGATPGTFFPTPTAAAPAEVEFTFVIANDSAAPGIENQYNALKDPVQMSIVASGAVKIELVRVGDSKILGTAQAASGITYVGGTFPLRKLDQLETLTSLLFRVKATKPDGGIVESDPILIKFP